MIDVYSKALDHSIQVDRIIGHIKGQEPGPTIIFTGGIHGNEPSGVFALKKVFEQLRSKNTQIKGNFYGLSGNLWALQNGQRYHTQDLNRLWTKGILAKLNCDGCEANHQDEKELKELYELISNILKTESGPFYFMDLHTTSSETNPFLTVNDSLLNRKFTQQYPVPIILGIEEYLDGPILSYINELGYVAFGFESGQHDDLSSIENHVAFIYLSLLYAGCVQKEDFDFQHHYDLLAKTSIDSRDIYEIFKHYHIEPGEKFVMKPGFVNFLKIHHNQELAESNGQKVRASSAGRIFMPLYQNQGEDGYFIIRRIQRFWFKLSAVLRKIKFDHVLTLLPGVRWVSNKRDQLVVNRNIARFFAKDFFHLLGYRSKKIDKSHLVMKNREAVARNDDYKFAPWYNGNGIKRK